MQRLLRYALAVLVLTGAVVQARAEDRFALLIGNSRYEAASPLRNPENDIEMMAAALETSGFSTRKAANVNHRDALVAVDAFIKDVTGAENPVVMVYFSGHGVQLDGENYLLPVDVKVGAKEEIKKGSISLGQLVARLDALPSRLQIIVLDSCRDNPFEDQTRGLQRGLAQAPEKLGKLIAFSTSPGNVASDGDTGTSPYASALAETVTIPGLGLEDVFKRVRATVKERTNGKQEPWENSAVYGEFQFVENRADAGQDSEIAIFEFAALADSQEAYQKYLLRFPNGMFANLAKQKIEFMDKDFTFRRRSETFRKFSFRRDEEDFCKRIGFVNSFAEGKQFPDDNEVILLDLYYEYHTKVCPDVGYLGSDYDGETEKTELGWSTVSAYGRTYSNFPNFRVIDRAVVDEYFPGSSASLFVYKIFDDSQFSLSVSRLDPRKAAFYSYNSCISSCISLTALVRTRIVGDEESVSYSFEVVDAAELGLTWKYQNTLSRVDAPVAEQRLASYRMPDPKPRVRTVDEQAAARFRAARDVAGWNVVAIVSDDGGLKNCRAQRTLRGKKLAFFRMYPGGALSFGYYDPATNLDPAYTGYAGYMVDGQTGGIVPIKAYSRQELAYDLGTEARNRDQLKAGSEIFAANERTSLSGSRAMLDELEDCVKAFGG